MGNSRTFRLIKKEASFLEGFSSLLDINSTISDKFRMDKTEEEADSNSLKSDWEEVGADLYKSITKYGKTSTK